MDLMEWGSNITYTSREILINSLKIINNTAERNEKIMEEFNEKFTKK